MCRIRLKSRCWLGCVPSGGSRGGSTAQPFSASSCCLHSLAHGSFLHLQAVNHAILTSASVATSFSLTPTLLPPSFIPEVPCDYVGSTCITQNDLEILSLTTSSKSLVPCKVTYSQVPGISMWTSLGGIILLTPLLMPISMVNLDSSANARRRLQVLSVSHTFSFIHHNNSIQWTVGSNPLSV